MTAKNYLRKIPKYNLLIKHTQEEIQELRTKAYTVTSIEFESDRVDTTKKAAAPFTFIAERLVILEKRLIEVTAQKESILEDIYALEDNMQIKVIYSRYVDEFSFDYISEKLNVSQSYVYKLHGLGLLGIQRMIDKHNSVIKSDKK